MPQAALSAELRTVLSNFEKLIGIPANNTTLKSAPAPLNYAGDDHRLSHAQLGSQGLPPE